MICRLIKTEGGNWLEFAWSLTFYLNTVEQCRNAGQIHLENLYSKIIFFDEKTSGPGIRGLILKYPHRPAVFQAIILSYYILHALPFVKNVTWKNLCIFKGSCRNGFVSNVASMFYYCNWEFCVSLRTVLCTLFALYSTTTLPWFVSALLQAYICSAPL